MREVMCTLGAIVGGAIGGTVLWRVAYRMGRRHAYLAGKFDGFQEAADGLAPGQFVGTYYGRPITGQERGPTS